MNKTLTAALAAALLAAAGVANADDDDVVMTKRDVQARLLDAGYADVRNLHKEGDHYEATARKNGRIVKVEIDGRTGDIDRDDADDADRDRHHDDEDRHEHDDRDRHERDDDEDEHGS